jgi:hypothetical protein
MKNPFLSLWLSNANRALGMGRGLVTAEIRRQQSAGAKEAMRAVGLGGATRPKKKAAKRKAKQTSPNFCLQAGWSLAIRLPPHVIRRLERH